MLTFHHTSFPSAHTTQRGGKTRNRHLNNKNVENKMRNTQQRNKKYLKKEATETQNCASMSAQFVIYPIIYYHKITPLYAGKIVFSGWRF